MEEEKTFDYTDEMYFEDNRLCRWFLYKRVRQYPYLSMYEDDLYSKFIYVAYKARQRFDETRGVKYSSYLLKSLKFILWNYLKNYNSDFNNDCISLDKPVGDDDFSLLDTFGYTYDFEANARYFDLISIIKKVILRFKSEKQQNILKLQLKNFNLQETANKSNCSRQYVYLLFEKFKAELQQQIINEKFLDESYFDKKYDIKKSVGFTKYSKYAYLKEKFNLSNQLISKYYKRYEQLDLKIDFDTFVTQKMERKQKLKDLTSEEKKHFYYLERLKI